MELTKKQGAILYTRVSTGEQADNGTSLVSQRDACRAKALALGLPIVAEYEDAGVSGGFLLSRVGMQAALAAVREGRANTLICANLTRYSRDVEHQQSIKKEVRAAGGRLVFCDMDFDDTPEGDLAFGIMGNFAEYEKAVIRKRLMGGRQKRAEQGLQPARCTSPYGYHIIRHDDIIRGTYEPSQVGQYIIREDQAANVRRLFACYAAGTHSLSSLSQMLNSEGVSPPGRAARWNMTTLHYILANPVYKGTAFFGRTDNVMDEGRLLEQHWHSGEHLKTPYLRRPAAPETWVSLPCPSLVSEETWDAVQARFTENKAQKGGNPRRVRMMAGRIFCPHCGGGLICCGSRRQHERLRYVCGHYQHKDMSQGSRECSPTAYPVLTTVEASVLLALEDAARRPEVIQAALAAYSAPDAPSSTPNALRSELRALDNALAELSAQESASVHAQIAGIRAGANPDAYAAVFADLAAQRKDLEDRRGQIAVRLSKMEKPQLAHTLTTGGGPERDITGILHDMRRVLLSEAVSGAAKRDCVGQVVAKAVPYRLGKWEKARQMEVENRVEVYFVPHAFAGEGETLQTIRTVLYIFGSQKERGAADCRAPSVRSV